MMAGDNGNKKTARVLNGHGIAEERDDKMDQHETASISSVPFLFEMSMNQPANDSFQTKEQIASEAIVDDREIKSDRLAEPTLFLGVGGSGVKIGTMVKQTFLESHGRMPKNVAILCIDSANDQYSVREHRAGSIITLEPSSELLLLDKVPVAGIKRNIHRHPELVERLGQGNLEKINRAFIAHGAAQQRPQGLAALVWNVRIVAERIENTIHRLTERTRDLRYELEGKASIKVFIFGSIAGGQGSGAILDIAYIVRERLATLGSLGESSTVAAALLLPGAFHEIENAQMQANAFAFAEEMNSLMLSRFPFEATYPGGTQIHSIESPFDQIYIADGIDEHGRSWANQDEICGLCARTLWLLASSEVGAREINSMINESGVLQGESEDGQGTYCGAVGQAVIRWPAREAAERCSLRHALSMINKMLERVGELTADDSTASLVDAGTLREQLNSSKDGAPYQVRLSAPAALEKLPVDEQPIQTRNLAQNYFQRRLYDVYFKSIADKTQHLERSVMDDLGVRFDSMCNMGRLAEAGVWLQPMLEAAERQLQHCYAEQGRLSQLAEEKQGALESAAAAMDRAAANWLSLVPYVGRGQMQGAINTYLEEAGALARLRLAQRVEELVGDIVRSVVDWLQTKNRQLSTLTARLHQTSEWLASQEATLSRRTNGYSEISLAEPALLDHFYQKYAGNVVADMQIAINETETILEWNDRKPQEIAYRLMQSALATFTPVLQLTVEDILSLRWHDRSAVQWTERLCELAAGAWNLDHSLLKSGGVGMASFLTVGVPDESSTLFANCGHTLVSTHDPERIIALRTIYGASWDTLKPYPFWRHAYERLSRRLPLHILRQYHHSNERTVQIFALGMIFGHIDNRATWYYYTPSDQLKQETRLDQGLEKSFRVFADMHALQDELLIRVEAEIADQGTAKAVERIQTWVNREGKKDSFLIELRRAAREYLNELQVGQLTTRQENGLAEA